MQELIIIFIVALLVFGPKKLPELGNTFGKGIAGLKRAMAGIKEQVESETQVVGEQISFTDDASKKEEEMKESAENTKSAGDKNDKAEEKKES